MPRVKMESNWRRVKETIQIASWAGLAVIPLLYLTGFLAWSLHASRENLGLLPVSPVQYISVGVIVLLLVISVVGIDLLLHYLSWNHVVPRRGKRRIYVYISITALIGIVAVAGGTFVLSMINQWFPMFDDGHVLITMAIISVMIIFFANVGAYLAFSMGAKESRPNGHLYYIHKNAPWLRSVINSFVIILIFSMLLLPAMSTEFGGAQERTASFDLEIENLSKNTLNDLWPNWNVTNKSGVVRTPDVKVLFSNEEILIVRSCESRSGELVDLQRSIFKAILWSGDEDKSQKLMRNRSET